MALQPADETLLTEQYNAWLNSPAGQAVYAAQATTRTTDAAAANNAMAAAFRAWGAPTAGTPPNPALAALLNDTTKTANVNTRLGTLAATAPTPVPAPVVAPTVPPDGRFTTVESARAWVITQMNAAQGEARRAWESVSNNLDSMYQSGRALVIKDGKIDTSGLTDWLSARGDDVKNAFNSLSSSSGSFLGGIWDMIKNNKFTLGAGVLAAFAGNALGLGTIGTILLGVVGMGLGGALGDGASGFVGRLLLPTPPPPPGGQVQAPAQAPIVVYNQPGQTAQPTSTLSNPETRFVLADNATLTTPTVQVQTIAPGATIPGFDLATIPEASRPTNSLTITESGRTITYFGRMDGETFVGSHMRIGDATTPTRVTPVLTLGDAARLRVATTTNNPGVRQVTFDAATSRQVITAANGGLDQLAGINVPASTVPATNLLVRVNNTDNINLVAGQEYNITVTNADGTQVVSQMMGRVNNNNQLVVTRSGHSQDNNGTNLTGVVPHKRPVLVTLGDGGSLNISEAITTIKRARTAETAGLYSDTRNIPLRIRDDDCGFSCNENNVNANFTASIGATEQQVNFNGTLSGTGEARVMTIPAVNSITVGDRVLSVAQPITVNVGTMDINADGGAGLLQRLSNTPAFMNALRGASDANNIPLLARATGRGREATV